MTRRATMPRAEWYCGLLLLCLCALAEEAPEGLATEGPTTAGVATATTEPSYRRARWHLHDREGFQAVDTRALREDYQNEEVLSRADDSGDTKAIGQAKYEYSSGYYDFLINEGSYKFWAVFQLATAALLIYSGFAALYYAKVNPQVTDDYDDLILRRRKRAIGTYTLPRERPYHGFQPESFQRILDAIAREIH